MSFDLVAPVYDGLARLMFGHRLERAQTLWLTGDYAKTNVLIVGGGTGFLLDVLLADPACRPARIVYLEASAQMLHRTTRRLAKCLPTSPLLTSIVQFRHGTETDLRPDDQFDLILLPFVLDLYPDAVLQTRFIPRLLVATRPGGHWVVTDFAETPAPADRLLRWTMFRFFRLFSRIPARTLPDWPRHLTDAGLIVLADYQAGMLRSVRLQALQ